MGSKQLLRRAAAGAILIAGICAASPALAGRCGHSYAVDAPTTLSKVARACNVSYAALAEANRGVDPTYVRPGEHLAVPDEVKNPTDIAAPNTDLEPADADYAAPAVRHPYIASRPLDTYRSYSSYNDYGDVRRMNVSANATAPATYFDTNAAPVYASRDSRLSYQKLSAARIRSAGYARQPVMRSREAVWGGPNVIRSVNAYPTPLMECSVLRRQPDGKIRQVREVKIAPENEQTPVHCASVTLSEPASAIVTRGATPSSLVHDDFALFRGRVTAVDGECITLRGDDGMTWHMSAPLAANDMLGKDATVWAAYTRAPACGGFVLSHAVYAERL